ncbi:hypothetical protein [Xanthomonas theicola]|uniref:hypothetical protein n=1 Tax=Xanthomonas theicola TaxID=56464 RepID=UPI001304E4B7|nr:hypothetical protein [Xanthomonas theicola]
MRQRPGALGRQPDRGQADLRQRLQHGLFAAAAGFQHDRLAFHRCQAFDQQGMLLGRSGLDPGQDVRQDMRDAFGLGDIDPDKTWHGRGRSPQ